MKKSIIVAVIIVVAAALVFFSIFWPLDKAEDLKGTIGGVEKAKKFRGEQMDASDILVDNEEFNTLIQSAEWQNALKNEELMNFLKSDDFNKYVRMMGDMQKMVVLNFYFNTIKSNLMAEPELNEEVIKAAIAKEDFQKLINSQNLLGPLPSSPLNQDSQNVFAANLDNLEAVDFIEVMRAVFANNSDVYNFFSQDMQKLINSENFEKLVNSKDFEKLISQDFQNAGSWSQNFQKAFASQDLQKVFASQDFQNVIVALSQDFQKNWLVSQDFQNVYMSQDFQALLRNNFFKAGQWNNDFQQSTLGAFQDYMNIIF